MRRPRATLRLAAVSRRPLSWIALAATAAALSACGDDEEGTIAPSSADAMRAELDQVEQAQAEGLCENAQAAAIRFRNAVNQLGADVDREVKGALQGGANKLVELSSDPEQCGGTTGVQGETTDTTTTPTTTETTTEEPPPPPTDEGDDDAGQGNGPPGGEPPGQGDGSGDDNGSGGTGSDKVGD
jgi:hypothetical protein